MRTYSCLRSVFLPPLFALVGAAGCGERAVDTHGPLALGGDPAGACLNRTVKDSLALTYGEMRPRNTGDQPITLTRVWLEKAKNFTLIKAWVLPGTATMTLENTYPPKMVSDWDKRRAAVGSTIEPGGEVVAMVGLTARNNASFKAVVLEYKDTDGNKYQARTSTEISVKPECQDPG